MTDTVWALLGGLGLVLVILGNALRARRTKNVKCLGHLFVSTSKMTTPELLLNRSGIVLFVVGIGISLIL